MGLLYLHSLMSITNYWIHSNFGLEPNIEPVLNGICFDSLEQLRAQLGRAEWPQISYLSNYFFSNNNNNNNNSSGFFLWGLPVVRISPEWVTRPEHGKSFSFRTDLFWDGISSIRDETVILLWLGRNCLVCENRVYCEKVRMTLG